MKLQSFTAVLLVLWFSNSPTHAQKQDRKPIESVRVGSTVNVHKCDSLYLAGQPTESDIEKLKDLGIKRIITLRTDGEVKWDEKALAEKHGIEFVQLPFRSPKTLTDKVFDDARKLLAESGKTKTILHCGSANRVGAVWFAFRTLDQGVPTEVAFQEAKKVGLRSPGYEQRAVDYVARKAKQEKSVRPGVNKRFLDPSLEASEWLDRFEVESREVYSARDEVVKACGITPGAVVADVGSGTGLFARLFSNATGEKGWVFALDISPKFVEHLNKRASDEKIRNLSTVLCSDKSISLPPNSVDVVFICDTYHHFEFPQSTLASIHSALRKNGTLVIVDFDRIPDVSREWILDHVRAGKKEVTSEIQAAGFALEGEIKVEGLAENYLLKFRKRN